MSIIAITTATPVVPFSQNPKQPQLKQQTAKEAIAANVQAHLYHGTLHCSQKAWK